MLDTKSLLPLRVHFIWYSRVQLSSENLKKTVLASSNGPDGLGLAQIHEWGLTFDHSAAYLYDCCIWITYVP
jgi:hypothetical protein